MKLVAPFPYFGGKRLVAPEIWRRFGYVFRFIEPFAGGASVFLSNPRPAQYEVLNDANGLLVNAWRGIKYDPRAVWRAANRPVAEVELNAVHARMMQRAAGLPERLSAEVEYHDAELAGWWVWGMCGSIGGAWAEDKRPNSVPFLAQWRGLQCYGPELLKHLSRRLARTLVTCGDWGRCVTDAVVTHHASPTNVTGVFLDPPYAADGYDVNVYGAHSSTTVAHDVRAWALRWGDDPRVRVALCGYDEHDALEAAGWTPYAWKAGGGFKNGSANGNANRFREVVWFSPHCLKQGAQLSLFDLEGV